MSSPQPNQKAPDFSLLNQHGKSASLKDFKGKWIVLYFYPKDNTHGCTTEAIEFTKHLSEFKKLNAVIVGVSPDTRESHCMFRKEHHLDIILLSDQEKKALIAYDCWREKANYGKKYWGVHRSTFLISPEGKIAHCWYGVKPEGHAEEALEALRILEH
mgnify:CR=1 FL=1